jgi:hypothetical protein
VLVLGAAGAPLKRVQDVFQSIVDIVFSEVITTDVQPDFHFELVRIGVTNW